MTKQKTILKSNDKTGPDIFNFYCECSKQKESYLLPFNSFFTFVVIF